MQNSHCFGLSVAFVQAACHGLGGDRPPRPISSKAKKIGLCVTSAECVGVAARIDEKAQSTRHFKAAEGTSRSDKLRSQLTCQRARREIREPSAPNGRRLGIRMFGCRDRVRFCQVVPDRAAPMIKTAVHYPPFESLQAGALSAHPLIHGVILAAVCDAKVSPPRDHATSRLPSRPHRRTCLTQPCRRALATSLARR